MEELKKWALGVCAAAIFSSVVYALVPKGNMQKIMRCVAAAAVICALVFPLANALIKTDFSLDSSDTEALIPSGLNGKHRRDRVLPERGQGVFRSAPLCGW